MQEEPQESVESYDEDGEVKYRTADALADISKDLSDN